MAGTNVEINLQLKKLDQVVNGVGKINKNLDRTNKSVESTRKSFNLLNTVIGGAIALRGLNRLAGAIGNVTRLAQQQEDAVNRLNSALRINGGFSEQASRDFQAFASSLQQVTRLGDETILNQIALAKSFGATNEQAKEIVSAGADLAAAFGQDISFGVRNVARTLGGFAGELGEIIPQLKNFTAEQLQSGEAIEFLRERFRGFAEREAQTFSGALDRLNNGFSDFLQSIGAIITDTPSVTGAVETSIKAFKILEGVVNDNREAVGRYVTRGLITVVGVINAILRSLNFVSDAFDRVTGVIATFVFAIEQVSRAFGRSDVSISEARKNIEEFSKTLQNPPDQGESFLQAAIDQTVELRRALEGADSDSTKLKNNLSSTPITTGGNRTTQGRTSSGGTQGPGGSGSTGDISDQQKQFFALGGQIVGSIQQGAEGAAAALGNVAGLIANTILPGVGQLASQIFQFLAQGPEAVRAQVQAFIDQIPVIIENIAGSIGIIIEAIAERIPVLVERIIALLPRIAVRAGVALAAQAPFIANRLATELIKNAPDIAKGFVDALVDEASRFVDKLVDEVTGAFGSFGIGGGGGSGGGGGGVGGFIGGIGDALGFNRGGEVPGGGPFVDRVPAVLTPGELVVDRGTTGNLKDFIKRESSDASNNQLIQEIRNLSAGLGGGQNLTVNLSIGEEQLADVLLNINQRGLRTA